MYRNHPEVAMTGFGRVHEKRGRAGRSQRCCDLVADMAGLAHAGDDDPALCAHNQATRVDERVTEAALQRVNGSGFDFENLACQGE